MAWIHNSIILPLVEPERHRGLGRRLRELARFERMSADEQTEYQAVRVRKMLRHAYDTVPFYRHAFDRQGSRPEDWQPSQTIPLPTIDRETLRDQHDQLYSRRYQLEDLKLATTGGTTSTPVRIHRDIEALRERTALQFHLNRLSGFDQGDSVMNIWGAERDFEANPSWKWRLYEETLLRRVPAPAGNITEKVLENFASRWAHAKPKVLYGYGVTMSRFAEFVRAQGKPYHKPSVIISTAEAITSFEREIVESTFECKLSEQYGSREIGMVAWECEAHTGLHFHPANSVYEFDYQGETPDGPIHELIVTDLTNLGMPLIRYRTGDCVQLGTETCSCGRHYPKVKAVMGRAVDTFILADGMEIPGIAVANQIILAMYSFRSVKQLQIVQKQYDHIEVRYVASGADADTESDLQRVQAALAKAFRTRLHCTMVRQQNIPRSASGKLRLCISEVPRPQRDSVSAGTATVS